MWANRTDELDKMPEEWVTDMNHAATEAVRKAPEAIKEEEEDRRVDALPEDPAKEEEARRLTNADADALKKALLMPVRYLP